MTRKANHLAETMVRATSRRGFLSSAAKLAAGAAAMLGGALAVRPAQAAPSDKTASCCAYIHPTKGEFVVCFRGKKAESGCPQVYKGMPIYWEAPVSDCKECW